MRYLCKGGSSHCRRLCCGCQSSSGCRISTCVPLLSALEKACMMTLFLLIFAVRFAITMRSCSYYLNHKQVQTPVHSTVERRTGSFSIKLLRVHHKPKIFHFSTLKRDIPPRSSNTAPQHPSGESAPPMIGVLYFF